MKKVQKYNENWDQRFSAVAEMDEQLDWREYERKYIKLYGKKPNYWQWASKRMK